MKRRVSRITPKLGRQTIRALRGAARGTPRPEETPEPVLRPRPGVHRRPDR